MRTRPRLALIFLAWAFVPHLALSATSDLKPDEEMILFPAIGRLVKAESGGSTVTNPDTAWEVDVRGCVYEPEQRRWTLAALAKSLDLGRVRLTSEEQALLAERARLFMVDNERSKRIVVRWRERRFDLGRSGPDGRFAGVIRIDASDVGSERKLELEAVLPTRDLRQFTCAVTLLEDSGWTVISDIDDTIKLTDVSSVRSIMRATFLKPFAPVTGMPELYRKLATRHRADFLYVSASPWQLYPVFDEFLLTEKFPSGVFFFKDLRAKDRTLANLFASPVAYKTTILRPLLENFPNRRFILIGDSGEQDPEIYAALRNKYPRQVAGIWIRDTTGGFADTERCRRLSSSGLAGTLKVFTDPSTLVLPEPQRREPGLSR